MAQSSVFAMQPIRIELPTGLQVGTVNVYLFTEPEPVLVDAGMRTPESWEALQVGLAENGLTVLDLSRIFITHAHIDHYGQAGTIVTHSDADVWISDLGASWLTTTNELWQHRLLFYQQEFLPKTGLPQPITAGIVAGLQALAAQVDPIPLQNIHTFRLDGVVQMGGMPWQVLYTPGHASMQTCFYQPQTKQLLSADMLLAITPTPVVEAPPPGQKRRVPALPQYLKSLAILKALDVDQVYPGHGRPFTNHRKVIKRQYKRIMQRKAECLEFITAGCHTVAELLDKMYAHHPAQQRIAGLWMLIGYLDLLEEDGTIEKSLVNGVWHFAAHESTPDITENS